MMTTLQRAVLLSLIVMLLASCGSAPVYTPDAATLATREADEYQAKIDNAGNLFTALYIFFIAMLALFFGLSLFLSAVAYRKQDQGVRAAKIANDRLEFIALGEGKAYHIPTKTVIATAQASSIAAQIMPAQQLPPAAIVSDSQYIVFLQRAAHVHPDGWHGKTIPGHREIGMSGGNWTACTRPMIDDGLIDTSPTGTVITEGRSLLDLYNLIMANPY